MIGKNGQLIIGVPVDRGVGMNEMIDRIIKTHPNWKRLTHHPMLRKARVGGPETVELVIMPSLEAGLARPEDIREVYKKLNLWSDPLALLSLVLKDDSLARQMTLISHIPVEGSTSGGLLSIGPSEDGDDGLIAAYSATIFHPSKNDYIVGVRQP